MTRLTVALAALALLAAGCGSAPQAGGTVSSPASAPCAPSYALTGIRTLIDVSGAGETNSASLAYTLTLTNFDNLTGISVDGSDASGALTAAMGRLLGTETDTMITPELARLFDAAEAQLRADHPGMAWSIFRPGSGEDVTSNFTLSPNSYLRFLQRFVELKVNVTGCADATQSLVAAGTAVRGIGTVVVTTTPSDVITLQQACKKDPLSITTIADELDRIDNDADESRITQETLNQIHVAACRS